MSAEQVGSSVIADDGLDFFGNPPPPHVPRHLLRRFDLYDGEGSERDPFILIRRLRDEPPMIYNLHQPQKGQSWIPTRAADIRAVSANPALFSAEDQLGFGELIGEDWKLGPLEMDPPQHTMFRKFMNPWLSPSAVGQLSEHVRLRAVELIEPLQNSNGCEFMSAFGVPYPISIFMEMFGLPREHMGDFLRWNSQLLHTGDPEIKMQGIRATVDYLRTLIEDRRRAPANDIVSQAIAVEIDGEPLSDTDLLGVCYLLFAGGLDTVAASLGFHFSYLAQHPEQQARLRANHADIPRAVEELLRAFSPSQALRRATADTELGGVTIRKGDWINIIMSLANIDPDEFPDPDTIDLARQNNRHFTFSFGNHFCMGSHLARRELQIAYEEWMTRLPPFRLAPGEEPVTHAGLVLGVDRLVLEW